MKWTGPTFKDMATPLAWLAGTFLVLGVIYVADEGLPWTSNVPQATPTTTTTTTTTAVPVAGAPVIESVAPASGSIEGGTEVRILGRNIHEDALVSFDGMRAEVRSWFETEDTQGALYELIVIAPAHDAEAVTVSIENPDGQWVQRDRAFVFVDYAATSTPSPTPTNTTTSTTSTTTSSTSSSTSSSTTTTSTPSMDDHSDVVWAFDQADADDGIWYNYVAYWPHGGTQPQGKIGWENSNDVVDTWDFLGDGAPETLGAFQVRDETGAGLAFGGNNLVAELSLYAITTDGELAAAIPGPEGDQRFPHHAQKWPNWADEKYFFGNDQQNPPSGTSALPYPISLFRGELVGLMDGRHAGEVATIFVSQRDYPCSTSAQPPNTIFPPCYGDFYLTGRLDAIYAGS